MGNGKQDKLLLKWKKKLDQGRATKKKWMDDFRVVELDRYMEGFQRPSHWLENDFLSINLMFPNVKSQIDNFLIDPPNYTVRPSRTMVPDPRVTYALDAQANLRENTLNYLIKENKFRREFKKAILDAYPAFGVVKTIYEPLYEMVEGETTEPLTDATGAPLIDAATGEMATLDEPGEREELVGELFTISRRNPSNILLDPFADSIETIEWVAERVEYTLSELKENNLYSNVDEITVFEMYDEDQKIENDRKRPGDGETEAKPLTGGNSSLPSVSPSTGGGDDDTKIVFVWEIFDIKDGRIIAIPEGNEVILRDDPTPDSIEEHPYVFIWFNDRRNSAYPIPELFNQLGPQDEYNITRNQIVTHRKRFNRKYEVREGAISDEELAKMEEGYDGLVVKKKTDGRALTAIEDATLNSAVYFDVEMLRRDFMDISGDAVPDSDIAGIEKAGVANLLNQRMASRKGGKIGAVRHLLQETGRKMMLLMEHEMTIPMAIRVSGQAGANWQRVTPSQFGSNHGEFEYEIDIHTITPRDPDNERTSWISFLQFIAVYPQIGQSELLMKKTAKMFGMEDQALLLELIRFAKAAQEQQQLNGGQGNTGNMADNIAKIGANT